MVVFIGINTDYNIRHMLLWIDNFKANTEKEKGLKAQKLPIFHSKYSIISFKYDICCVYHAHFKNAFILKLCYARDVSQLNKYMP